MLEDIDFLVRETFKHLEESRKLEQLPEMDGPGFIYKIEKNTQTFVLRIYPSEDLLSDKELLEKMPTALTELKMETQGETGFFACDYGMALHLQKHLANRRFSINEDIYTLSQADDDWWLAYQPGRLNISFKKTKTTDLLKLGPVATKQEYKILMNVFFKYFSEQFNLEFIPNDSGFELRGEESFLADWGNLFQTGRVTDLIEEVFRSKMIPPEQRKSSEFFKKLAHSRRFLKMVYEKLVHP
ncbi:MAG: hypothetical protein JNM93_07240 [Bacteriovoracaceae bacterium]|nr:hypothetical protein [Bacteriovoracaceae bacterium]